MISYTTILPALPQRKDKPKSNKLTTYHARIKHRLKRMLKERMCSCNITYTKHGTFCSTLLSVKTPSLIQGLIGDYRPLSQNGIVWRPKRYEPESPKNTKEKAESIIFSDEYPSNIPKCKPTIS